MTEEISQSREAQHPQKFGNRLRAAREDLRLDLKDVASQLRLRPSIIEMLEKEMYSDDMPITFLRGYLRSYAKFLEIPDQELKSALTEAPFQPHTQQPSAAQEDADVNENKSINKILKYADKSLGSMAQLSSPQSFVARTGKKYFMRVITFVILFTMGCLVVNWWNSHKNFTTDKEPSAIETTTTPQQTALEPKLPTLAEASDQDLEAANDDQALVFEQDAGSAVASTKTAKSKLNELSMNETRNIIDIYNE